MVKKREKCNNAKCVGIIYNFKYPDKRECFIKIHESFSSSMDSSINLDIFFKTIF